MCLTPLLFGVAEIGVLAPKRSDDHLIPPFLMCLQPLVTLEGSITFTFSVEGMNTITVQVSAGNTILQDTKTIAVYGEPLPLSFSVDSPQQSSGGISQHRMRI